MAQSIGPHGVRRVADASGIASAVKLDARTISLAAASRFDSINTGWADVDQGLAEQPDHVVKPTRARR